MSKRSSYQDTIAYIESLIGKLPESAEKRGEKLARMHTILERFGHPESSFKIIHIAGTSGKGSTASMIHSILGNFGAISGLYLSPHATTTTERIQIGNNLVSENLFTDTVNAVKEKIEHWPVDEQPVYSEILLLTAFLCFHQHHCEYVVLESLLGGRFDRTNVCPSIIQVITSIGYDHRARLGNSLSEIAMHKIGIVKKNGRVFTGKQKTNILKLYKKTCQSLSASLMVVTETPQNIQTDLEGTSFTYQGREYCLNIPGEKQIDNSLLAISVANHLGIPYETIAKGLQNIRLPCRIETVQMNPRVILDAAHNKDEIKQLVSLLKQTKSKKNSVIFASVIGKNMKEMLQNLLLTTHNLYLTQFDNTFKKCYSPQYLLKTAKQYNFNGTKLIIANDPVKLLNDLLQRTHSDGLIIITGSYFLCGELRTRWFPAKEIARQHTSFPT
jgi:dihydrofolate synthase/folylpolyglutamate synthase